MLANKIGCLGHESSILPLLVLIDIVVAPLVVKTVAVPACVVVTVLVMSAGVKLPFEGDTGGEIKFSIGGITLFLIDIESVISDLGIGVREANIELGTSNILFPVTCTSRRFAVGMLLLFL